MVTRSNNTIISPPPDYDGDHDLFYMIHEMQNQTAAIKEQTQIIQEQTISLIEEMEYQNEKALAATQPNYNMIIVFSLVNIGAIVGLGFLIAWRPTHE
jgi:hypothetical protein